MTNSSPGGTDHTAEHPPGALARQDSTVATGATDAGATNTMSGPAGTTGAGIGSDSTDPRQVIPGDADALRELAWRLAADAATLADVAATVANLPLAGWAGTAAEAARRFLGAHAARFHAAADAARRAADAVARHADLIGWAHRHAREATALHADAHHVAAANPAAATTATAVALLERARTQLDTISRDTVTALHTARATLPEATRLLADPDPIPPPTLTPTTPATAPPAHVTPARHPADGTSPITAGPSATSPASVTPAASAVFPAVSPSAAPVSAVIGPSAPRTAIGRPHVIVQRGDTLYDLAARYLGDPRRWRDLFEANRGRTQLDGATLDRAWLLHPGWVLTLPDHDNTAAPADPPHPNPDRGTGDEPARPAPPITTTPGPTTGSPTLAAADQTSHPPRPPAEGTAVDLDTLTTVGTVVGVGAATLAITALLLARRHHPAVAGATGIGTGTGRAYLDTGQPPIIRAARTNLAPRTDRPAHGPAALIPPLHHPAPTGDRHPQRRRRDTPTVPTSPARRAPAPRSPAPPPPRSPVGTPTQAPAGPPARSAAPPGAAHDDATRTTPPRPRPEPGAVALPLATRDGQPIAHNITHAAGLALTGDADAVTGAARALLVAALTDPPTTHTTTPNDNTTHDGATGTGVVGVTVVLAIEDAPALLGADYADRPTPPWLHIEPAIGDWLHRQQRHQRHHAHTPQPAQRGPLLIVRAATAAKHADRIDRLHHAVNPGSASPTNGTSSTAAVIILGVWPGAHTRLHLTPDAVITRATGPGTAHLPGALAYRVELTAVRATLADLTPLQPDAATDTPDVADDPAAADVRATDPPRHPTTPAAPMRQPTTDPNPDQHPTSIRLSVFGPPRMLYRPATPATATTTAAAVDLSASLTPRTWELVLHLATHPGGDRRDTIIADLWPDTTPSRPTNTLNTAISRLRKAIAAAAERAPATGATLPELIVKLSDNRYGLNPDTVAIDYDDFADALTARRRASAPEARIAACEIILNTYAGPLADGHDAEWITPLRVTTLRSTLDAADTLAQHYAETDPTQAVAILEFVTTFDPYEEETYRKLIKLHLRLNQAAAARRVYGELTKKLSEIDSSPKLSTAKLIV